MKNRLLLCNRFSRRMFFCTTASVGVLGGLSLLSLNWFHDLGVNRQKRRSVLTDKLPLAEYIRREASKIEIFPYALSGTSVRFQASSTFERYMAFYRYKEKVLASTKEEVEDCVRQIDFLAAKEKALVLYATFIFDCIYRRGLLKHNRYWKRYQNWEKYIRSLPTISNISRSSLNFGVIDGRAYYPGKRSYFPYYYPALGFFSEARRFLILGQPSPNQYVDKESCQKWQILRNEYASSPETAFPSIPTVSDFILDDACEPALRRMSKSALRFPARGYPSIVSSSAYPSDLWSRHKEGVKDSNERFFLNESEKRNWFKWFKNIEECVAIVDSELGLKIPAERWISDHYSDSDAFLRKIAELENDESVPVEKVELLMGLREYWLSMQISFDYDSYHNYLTLSGYSAAPPPRVNPFFDVAETKSVTLGQFISFFCSR